MRITFLSPRSNLSGGTRVIATYARMLHDRGHQVTIVTPCERIESRREWLRSLLPGGKPEYADEIGHYHKIPELVHEAATSDFQFSETDIPDADAIIATWWETAFAAAAMPASKGHKCYLIQGHEVFSPLPGQISRATYYLPLQPLVVAGWLEDVMREEYGRNDAIVMPNGTDLSQFYAPARDKSPQPTIGFLYSSNPIKGTRTALNVVSRVQKKFPSLRVVAFGTETLPPEISLPSGSSYYRRPEQDEIRNIYAQCDVFLGTSTSEGFYLPLLEAMACRTPFVCTRVGAAPDLIVDGETGFVVDVEDEDALVKKVIQVLTLPEAEWKHMSDACFSVAQKNGWEQACDRMEQALTALLNGQTP